MNIFKWLKKKIRRGWMYRGRSSIDLDEIFLDSKNLPQFDRSQFEGRLEKPISRKVVATVGLFFVLVGFVYAYKIWDLQVKRGEAFAARSEKNNLRHTVVFADRGVIYDRNQAILAWNIENPEDPDFSGRRYATTTGISNLIGYVKYPSKDSAGFYYREDYVGMDGVEKFFDEKLKGKNGLKITEADVHGNIETQSVLNPPTNGENLTLSVDARVQSKLYEAIAKTVGENGFKGGAGVIMDIETGEVISLVTYPEYNAQILTDGDDVKQIQKFFSDPTNPFLDRATSGLYAPGSIVKPFMALGALNEKVISPNKILYTEGQISIPNPYNPSLPSVFRDWKNHGPIDMRDAIAQSSDVYFYQVGGGFEDQKGIGIANIDKYANMFGFGRDINSPFFGNKKGVVPTPEWKAQNFKGEPWRVGDTYHTVIGQYGFQVTPIQVVRAIAAIANYGNLIRPTILFGDKSGIKDAERIVLPREYFDVVHEGMRQSVTEGTAKAIDVGYVEMAAKTGTAEIGVSKDFVNSWVTGFFPYKNPRYAFVILMERGPRSNLVGASYVGRQLFDWMNQNTPEYFSESVSQVE